MVNYSKINEQNNSINLNYSINQNYLTNQNNSINQLKKILNENNIDIITLLYFINMIFNLKN